jgi:hypothetical protein
MEISDVEIGQLDKYIADFERRVNNWQRDRIFYLMTGLITLVIGAKMMVDGMRSLMGRSSPISEMELSERPEDVSLELWAVAEIRKTARLLELQYNILGLALISATVGLLIITGSFVLLVPLIIRWRDGGKEMVFTRILCAQWKMLREGEK